MAEKPLNNMISYHLLMYLANGDSRKTALQERQSRCGQRVGFWQPFRG
jgi:hypothetical protein